MDLLKAAAGFIAWASGSLAAIAGILYGFGFLATLSNLHLLGLDALVLSFEPSFYLQRGSRFALYVMRLLFETMLIPVIAVVVVVAVVLVVRRLRRGWGAIGKVEGSVTRLGEKIAAWPSLLYALLLLVLLAHMLPTYANLTNLLDISDLLFEPTGANAGTYDGETRAIRDALLGKGEGASAAGLLGTKFLFSVVFFLESALIFCLAWWLSARWRLRVLLTAPFALVLAMFFLSLPMIYGTIVLPNEFSKVRVTARSAETAIAGEYFLLNKTGDALVLWDDSHTRMLWLPLSQIEAVEIGRTSPLPLAGSRLGGRTEAGGERG